MLNIPINMEEVELQIPSQTAIGSYAEKQKQVMQTNLLSRKRSKGVEAADILTTVNPAPRVIAYMIECIRNNPISRAVFAFTNENTSLEFAFFASRMHTPILSQKQQKIPRLYALHLTHRKNLRPILEQALCFPNGKLFETKQKFMICEPTEAEKQADLRGD
jgi:hypothetical protein